jgi:HlyD family secretion protein
MDRARSKTKVPRIARASLVAAGTIGLVSGGVTLANIDFKSHRVDRDKLSIAVVQRGTMEIKVSANGQLLSNDIEQLVAQVQGRVARKDVRPGAIVKVGEVLVELTDPQLIVGVEQARSAWEGAVAGLQVPDSMLQTNMLNEEVVLAQSQFNLQTAQLKVNTDQSLADEQLIPLMTLKQSRLNLGQLQKICEIEGIRLLKLRESIEVELAVKKSVASQLARALDSAKTQAGDLKVVAGIGGIVQGIDVEVGQQLQPGSLIGSIAQQDELYAELKVPAREASQVEPGQKVIIDTRNGLVNGIVTRVAPGVTEGTVLVDADLQGALPAGARPQLQVEGVIYISELPNTLYVGKPAYVKNDAALTVYKLDSAARYATRVPIKVGKVSLNYLQVLQGLNAGDRIITSEINEFEDQDRVLLK